jgi:drug/metabolite transporter (DMT)-like permease
MADAARDEAGPDGGVLRGHAALLVVQLVFALMPVFGKLAMSAGRGFSPWALAAWRIAFGAFVLAVLARLLHPGGARPRRADLPRLGACALLGIVANQGLYLSGLERSSAVDAGLMMCLIPVFTYLIAAAVGQERWRVGRALGVAIACAGMLPLLFGRGDAFARGHGLGNALMAGNCLCYAGYIVMSKPLAARYPPLWLLAWIYLASLPIVPVFIRAGGWLPAAPLDPSVWLSMAYVLVFPSTLAYLLMLFALARVRASTTAFYIYLQPAISGFLGWAWLGEELSPNLVPAALGLGLGSWLVLRRREPTPCRTPTSPPRCA